MKKLLLFITLLCATNKLIGIKDEEDLSLLFLGANQPGEAHDENNLPTMTLEEALGIMQIKKRKFDLTQEKTAKHIRKKYLKLALKWHPDKNSGVSDQEKKMYEEKFKKLSIAYKTLKYYLKHPTHASRASQATHLGISALQHQNIAGAIEEK